MDTNEFLEYGKKTIEFIANYRQDLPNMSVISQMEPGYLVKALPENAPVKPESFDRIFDDLEKIIMPGVTHWNHPQFHGYFPAGNAYPNIIGDAINAAIGSVCFSWTSNPVGTELETIVLDWMARALDLPEHFMTDKSNFIGGGCFQGSASESTLLATFAARHRAISYLRAGSHQNELHDSVYLPQLVVYTSAEAHSSVEKACKMALIQLRILGTDEKGVLRGPTVLEAIKADLDKGLTPCMVVATLGTTGLVAFDDVKSIGDAITAAKTRIPIWFHVDGAYGGNTFLCPEMRKFKVGLEMADSFMVNPNKLMLGAFDMTCFWVRNVKLFTASLVIDPAYLKNDYTSPRQMDYRNYSVPLSRRFRALKLWFLLRSYGIEGLQSYVRRIKSQAKYFEKIVNNDPRFEVFDGVHAGLVGFRFKETPTIDTKMANDMTRKLVEGLHTSRRLYVVPHDFKGKIYIRFSVNYEFSTDADIDKSWAIIDQEAQNVKPGGPRKMRKPAPFSFFRSVSKDVYERQNSHPTLKDGATPIFVVEQVDILESLQKASLKMKLSKDNCFKIDTNNNGNEI